MFHKEGYKIILWATTLLAIIAIGANYLFDNRMLVYIIWIACSVILLLVLQFFRNPKRDFLLHNDHILSPVDGKVVVIEKVHEPEYFKGERLQVSIFMSPINVHVTRFPIGGKVVYSKYHAGKYLVAWHPKAASENERTTVVINHDNHGEVMYRQIAGALAKRIVNYAKEGTEALQGADSGFIKFGSRVDLYLPLDTEIEVQLNQKVKGGLSRIATLS